VHPDLQGFFVLFNLLPESRLFASHKALENPGFDSSGAEQTQKITI